MAPAAPSLPPTDEEPITLRKIFSESRRIVGPHQRHFQALTFLFIFPLSFVSLLFQIIQKDFQADPSKSFNQDPRIFILFEALFNILSIVITLFAFGSISYSTYHAFNDQPIDLISSLKSISHSFLPLLSTTLVTFLIGILIFSPLPALVLLMYNWLRQSSHFMLLVLVIVLIFFVVLVGFQVNWVLAYSVVVVESKWGYAPLKRSADLVKGYKGVALRLMFCPAFASGILFFGVSSSNKWVIALYLILGSVYLSQVLLGCYVANTVMYIYCKKAQEGDLPWLHKPEKIPLLK